MSAAATRCNSSCPSRQRCTLRVQWVTCPIEVLDPMGASERARKRSFKAQPLHGEGFHKSLSATERARGREIAMPRPPGVTQPRVWPPRPGRRPGAGFPFAPQRAVRSASIIATSTCSPACTHRPKKALRTSASTAASGATDTGTTFANAQRATAFEPVRDFFIVALFFASQAPACHMQAKGVATKLYPFNRFGDVAGRRAR